MSMLSPIFAICVLMIFQDLVIFDLSILVWRFVKPVTCMALCILSLFGSEFSLDEAQPILCNNLHYSILDKNDNDIIKFSTVVFFKVNHRCVMNINKFIL